MTDPLSSLSQLLSDVILPNLKSVQSSQAEQIAANDRLEQAIAELRMHLESQFALLAAQLSACQSELAATNATLKAAQAQAAMQTMGAKQLVH
jgi:hypothetical protein